AIWIAREIADGLERALFDEARTVVHLDTADLNIPDVQAFASLLLSLTEQGILVLVSSETPPGEPLQQVLGTRLVHCTESEVEHAVAFLKTHGVGLEEGSNVGEGI